MLIEWTLCMLGKYPELRLIHHIPNGGRRTKPEAARFKMMGVKAGVPDLCLPVPVSDKHGLYIELKAGRNTVTNEQRDWLRDLYNKGYAVAVCYGWEMAAAYILGYLNNKTIEEVAEYAQQLLCGRQVG